MDNRGKTFRESRLRKSGLGFAVLLLAAIGLSGCIIEGPGRYHHGFGDPDWNHHHWNGGGWDNHR